MPIRSLIKRARKVQALMGKEEGRRVFSNFVSLSVVQTITYLLPVVAIPYLFRVIGPGKFGLIAFAQAFTQYFMIFTDYGFGISATKEISLCRHDPNEVSKVFSAVMAVKLALAFISLLILAAIVFFIPKFKADWQVYFLSFGSVVGNTLFPVWFFQGIEKMRHIAYLNATGGVFILAAIFMLVHSDQDYLWVPAIFSSGLLITGLWAQRIVFSKFGVCFKFPRYVSFRNQITVGWDIFISNVAINAYTVTRIFVVGLLTDKTITGFYAIAEKLAGAVQSFPVLSFSQAVFPRLSQIFHKSKWLALNIMYLLRNITVSFSLIYLTLTFIFAPFLVRLFCGSDYYSTVLALRLLLIGIFFINSNAFPVQFLLVCGKTDVYSKIHFFNSMIGLPLIFLMVYLTGFSGAAIAGIAIEVGIFFSTRLAIKRIKV